MNKIHVLDCTLRDGGYCNSWRFGFNNIRKITQSLVDAEIDIIECGFLTSGTEYDTDITRFCTVDQLEAVLPVNRAGRQFVAMVNYGEYTADLLPQYDGNSIDGIRVAFHKKDLDAALALCREIKEKGYKVFIQAMVSLSYSDLEFISLIEKVNDINPYAFYIVDSFGMLKRKNLVRLFYMVENNLKEGIWIGFHSHNNMQLAYSNAQSLAEAQTNRNIIIDASIYGMGRGAGNLNTELFVEYLNENNGTDYELKPLLNVIDEILDGFYQQKYWGYSLPNYISAMHWAHPNYARYLSEKNTLTVEAMDEIFSMIPQAKRFEYDKAYIDELYVQYMETGNVQEEHKAELCTRIRGKKVVLIGPGKSSKDEKEKIIEFIKSNEAITVGVNFDYPEAETDFIFLSNLRRFRELDDYKKPKCIVTSNIPADRIFLQTKYYDLLNNIEAVRDNAGMMAIRFLINFGAKEIYLAGFDGYSHDVQQNYAEQPMTFVTANAVFDAMNTGMCVALEQMGKEIKIDFLTQPQYVKLV